MVTKCFLLDFEDSFTYNIASYYYGRGIDVEIISLSQIEKFLSDTSFKNKSLLIYGPGPGHPDDYSVLFPLIYERLKDPMLFHLGICMGHQLLWRSLGVSVIRSQRPLHGQTVDFTVPHWELFSEESWGKVLKVQRYNSLIVTVPDNKFVCCGKKIAYINQECAASWGERWLTYQFHPESIATEENMLFLEPPLTFFV